MLNDGQLIEVDAALSVADGHEVSHRKWLVLDMPADAASVPAKEWVFEQADAVMTDRLLAGLAPPPASGDLFA